MTQLTVHEPSIDVTEDQYNVLKDTICKGLTPAQMDLHFYECRRRNTHPMDKLIVPICFNGTYTPVTTVAFMKSRAMSTRECMGIKVVHRGDPGTTDHEAECTVIRLINGEKCPFQAEVSYKEFVGPSANWKKMPKAMLGKCAIASALRLAFADVCEGLYTHEEMDQAKREVTVVHSPAAQLDAAFPSSSTTGQGAVETVELDPATPDASNTTGLTTQEFLERIRALSDQEESPASQRRHDLADFLRAQQPALEALSEEDRTLVENYKTKEIRRLSVEAKDEPEYATVAPTRKRSRVKR